jgi:peptidoglycan hydrolase-like protein with peptidoglycan-binding domain
MAVTSTNNLRKGSKGSDVTELQKLLNNNGYNLAVDGSYGSKTLAAVQDYQKKNGLQVDGIVGTKTWGSLNSGTSKNNTAGSNTGTGSNKTNTGSNNANAGTSNNTFTTPAGNTYETFTPEDVTYDPFQGTETLNQAWATLGQLQGNAPGSWSDPYAEQRKGYLDQYENRDPFSYDFNSDALYQQYKDQYIQQGQMAMMDTMGQAAAMTGGYGNSYAQTVGQQAYNQQLNQLNAIMPELYDRAYGIYQQEGDDLLRMYDLYTGMSNESYNQYLGDADLYYKQLNAATQYAQNLYNKEYGEWADKTGMDIDIANNKNSIGLDTWATQTGIISNENQTLMNQKFQADENQKDRDHQSSENTKSQNFTKKENEKDRAAAAANAAAKSPYGSLNTEDTMTWIKKFEGAKDLNQLETYTTALQGIIGPEAAAVWYDTYAPKFKDEDKGDGNVETTGTGGGSGTQYWMHW